MGLRGNNLCPLYFKDVRVPKENVLGEPGEGFRIAMQILNNGRMSLGTGAVALGKRMLDLAIEHVTTRRQFGQPSATSTWSRRRSPGWSATSSGSSRWPT